MYSYISHSLFPAMNSITPYYLAVLITGVYQAFDYRNLKVVLQNYKTITEVLCYINCGILNHDPFHSLDGSPNLLPAFFR